MTNDNSWVEKYRPESWNDIQGHNSDIREIKQWAENWSSGDKPLLLVGEPGIGKTTVAYVCAEEMDFPTQEINASSARDKDAVARLASSVNSTPSDADRQLVLMDEVDSYHHSTNLSELKKKLKDPRNPVIMTANSKYDVPDSLKRPSRMFEMSLGKRSREAKLKDIIKAEGVDIDAEDLSSLAERPDLRSGINDLQRWAEEDVPPGNDERQWEEGAFEIVGNIMRGEPESGFGMTPDELVMWLDENVKKEYRGIEAVMAYECLRQADKYLGYAQDSRDYGYWKYATVMAEQVARVRVTEAYDGWLDLDFPQWFRMSSKSYDSESPEACLYRKMKDYEGGTFQFGGSYIYFRKVLLPMLQKLPMEERRDLALDYALDSNEIEALDMDAKDFDDWHSTGEVPEERKESEAMIGQSSAMDW